LSSPRKALPRGVKADIPDLDDRLGHSDARVGQQRVRRSLYASRDDQHHWRQREKKAMPFVNVKLIEGVFTPTQKRDMIRKLTDTMVSIEGENMRPVTWVVVEEVKSGDWGIAGNPLSTSDVKALAAGEVTA
jgi:4-oxalocrotonate tautomerase